MSRKKDWDLGTLLSVVGFVFELTRVTVNALRERNGTVDHLRRLLKEPELVNQVFDLIVEKPAAIVTATFQSLLDACHQDDYCNSDFTESRWPLEPIAADENDWEVVEHYLTKTGTLDEGMRQLDELAAKGEIRLLTGSRRAMEYIARHQEAQLSHPIILPLRARDSSGSLCLPVFLGNWVGRRRGLTLYDTDDAFHSGCGWLVLRPKSSDGASKRQK